jgi:Tol biopolymer transport system component
MKNLVFVCCYVLMICMLTPLPARDDAAQRLYQQGIFQMEAMGDFPAAIALFERLVREHPGNKSLASRALLMTGRCYEKLGKAEAEKAYNRILEDYGDQQEVVNEARVRLMALAELERLAVHTGMITRRIWQGPDVCGLMQPAPDANHIVFTDWNTGDLVLDDLVTMEQKPLSAKNPATEGAAIMPVFSQDGKYIAYTWYGNDQSCDFRVLDLESGEINVFLEEGFVNINTLAWSPSGKLIALIIRNHERESILGLLNPDENSFIQLKSMEEFFNPVKAAFSPDGRFLAYDHYAENPERWMSIYVLDIESNMQNEVVSHPSGNFVCDWTPNGSELVFVSDRTGVNAIYAIPVANGKAAGAPVLLKTDVSQAITPYMLTEDGSFFYGIDSGGRDVYTASFLPDDPDPFGPPVKISRRFQGANRTAAWSNDGRYIAYVAARQQRNINYSKAVVIQDVETGTEWDILLDVTTFLDNISWLPDNKSVVVNAIYLKDRQRHFALFVLNTKTGQITDTIGGDKPGRLIDPVWGQDGQYMYYLQGNYGDLRLIHIVKRDVETCEETVLLDPMESESLGRGSPVFRLAASTDRNMLALSRRSDIERRSDLFLLDLNDDQPEPLLLYSSDYPEMISKPLSFTGDMIYFIKSHLGETNFQRERELWSLNIASGESRKIASIPDDFLYFSLHPNGRSTLFNMGPRMNPCEIWVIDNLLPEP